MEGWREGGGTVLEVAADLLRLVGVSCKSRRVLLVSHSC
jgi:hypothetical protein